MLAYTAIVHAFLANVLFLKINTIAKYVLILKDYPFQEDVKGAILHVHLLNVLLH